MRRPTSAGSSCRARIAEQWLKFDRQRWQFGRPETAEYHCEGCETLIADPYLSDLRAAHVAEAEPEDGRSVHDREHRAVLRHAAAVRGDPDAVAAVGMRMKLLFKAANYMSTL